MSGVNPKRAVIAGAGPAGLTAAYELLTRAGVTPVVLEKSEYMGGISRTARYKGNRMDIGGHRFFSKSDRVMQWWLRILPVQGETDSERVMLVRQRKSRIYYLRRFFDYPISLSKNTLQNFGLWRTFRIGMSYMKSLATPRREERSLEDFFINRFGFELYNTFFKSYTEKVWGAPCSAISAQWGAQRIKGLSVAAALVNAARKMFGGSKDGVRQKNVQTSLIEQFLYPKYGPGQMWEEAARQVGAMGGEVLTGFTVDRWISDGWRVRAVEAVNRATGERRQFEGDYFFSTVPIKELVHSMEPAAPANVREVAGGLVYRDFITVGLLVRSLKIGPVADNWIYIQEPDVQLGRLQIFNNWSPSMVNDPKTVWLGLEYFCNESDRIWNLKDEEMVALATEELSRIGIINAADVLDGVVHRMEKAYPAYFGAYDRFSEIREHVDRYENLFLIGRNGMHRYNNQDHSMLTAMMAVDKIIAGSTDKAALWDVNTEMDYHEAKRATTELRR